MRHAIMMTLRMMLPTSLPLAWVMKQTFEGKFGSQVLYDFDQMPFWYHCLTPLLYCVVADTWFYFTHRFFHEVETLYHWSHKHHHSHRPSNSYAGHAADWVEVSATGYANAIVPAFVFPMHAQVFIAMLLVDQFYSIFLHNNQQYRVPGGLINDCAAHNVHHFYGQKNYNFGLYFTFWDKSLGTYKDISELSSLDFAREKHHARIKAFRERSNEANKKTS